MVKYGSAVLAFAAVMGLSACAGEDGATGAPGKDGIDGIDGEDGAKGAKGEDGENGTNGTSCSAELNKDKAGYVLSCDGKEVGTILNGTNGSNGENGKNGNNGTSCTAKQNEDKTGYILSCNDEKVGEIMNGAPGATGDGCSLTALKDGSGVMVACGKEDGVKITNGTSVTCEAEAYDGDDGVGTTMSCSDGTEFNILNGEKGEDGKNGSALDALGLMMAAASSQREYVGGELGSVVDSKKGVGLMETWNGADQKERVNTGLDKDGESGYWYFYSDDNETDKGNTKITFPVTIPKNKSMTGVIAACNGICAAIELGDAYEYPFAGFGFNITGAEQIGGNVENWNGVCIAYTAGASEGVNMVVELSPQDEKKVTAYDNFVYKIPSSNNAVVNIPWSAFAQEGWGDESSIAKTNNSLASLKFKISGPAGATSFINIQKVGMYGQCGTEENLFSAVPQYKFAKGTDILTAATISVDEKGSGIKTWNYKQSNAVTVGQFTAYWYDITDEVDESGAGNTKFTFAAPYDIVGEDKSYGLAKTIEACDGVCGSIKFGNQWDDSEKQDKHWAKIGFNVGSLDRDVSADITNWNGVCLTYTSSDAISVDVDFENTEKLADYDNPMRTLPASATPITVNLKWEEFAQAGWGDDVSVDYALKNAMGIRVNFQGEDDATAQFNIMQFGAYGNCN